MPDDRLCALFGTRVEVGGKITMNSVYSKNNISVL